MTIDGMIDNMLGRIVGRVISDMIDMIFRRRFAAAAAAVATGAATATVSRAPRFDSSEPAATALPRGECRHLSWLFWLHPFLG